MPLVQEEKFYRKHLKLINKVQSVKLNDENREQLVKCMYRLQQTKPSTALKQLAEIGAKVILDEKTGEFLAILLDNIRKNDRLGITDVKAEIDAKVSLE